MALSRNWTGRYFPLIASLNASRYRHKVPFDLSLLPDFPECIFGEEVASVVEEIVDFTVG